MGDLSFEVGWKIDDVDGCRKKQAQSMSLSSQHFPRVIYLQMDTFSGRYHNLCTTVQR